MAASFVVSAPFTLRMPVHALPRLFGRRRVVPVVRHALAAPMPCITAATRAPHHGDSGDWTAEEQDFLRALREAGL